MDMKSVLVTGSNGYIGRHVVEELSRGGVKVVTLDRDDAAPAGSSCMLPPIFSTRTFRSLGL